MSSMNSKVVASRIIPAHKCWNALKTGSTREPNKSPRPMSLASRDLLKQLMRGSTLEWIDSWAGGMIKTNFHPRALQIATPDQIIDATIGWIFDWEVTYTFYCKTQLGEWYDQEYTYREKNTTIKALTDIINNNVRLPALDRINQLHLYDEGWKATILR